MRQQYNKDQWSLNKSKLKINKYQARIKNHMGKNRGHPKIYVVAKSNKHTSKKQSSPNAPVQALLSTGDQGPRRRLMHTLKLRLPLKTCQKLLIQRVWYQPPGATRSTTRPQELPPEPERIPKPPKATSSKKQRRLGLCVSK